VRRDVLVLYGIVVAVLAVCVSAVGDGHRHKMEVAVTHAAPGDELVGKFLHTPQRPAQHAGLQAMIVVEMDMQGGHREIVMVMLRIGELPGKIPLVMIVNVGQDADAVTIGIFIGPLSCQKTPQQIAHSL